MVRQILILLFSFIITYPAHAESSPFTLQALYKIQSIGAPHISPNGRQVAFTVTSYDLENSEQSTHLWLMNTDGSDLHRLTKGDMSVSHPRWHPDGNALLYVATDSVTDAPQAFQIDLTGESVIKLTDFSMGISAPNWSSTGDHLIFTSRVFPDAGADSDLNNSIQTDMDAGPVHAHVTDDLFYRHWDFYKDGKRRHTFALNLETKVVTDLTPGEYESPRFDLGGGDGYDI
ncbi:MAG TPA: S9 family peptidase, partial [bacterium]|nr:S9 family peptidase [bacterium]